MHGHGTAQAVDEDQAILAQMARIVPTYDAYMRKATFGREQQLRELTVDLAALTEGASVLEVGCGTGTLALAAKRRVGPAGQVCGIDLLPGMIELSRRKFADAGLAGAFETASIEAIPHAHGQFDAVLCSFMVFHMSEQVRRNGLRELHRVLKPQGRLVVVDLTPPPSAVARGIARLLFNHMLDHDLRELAPELSAAGFTGIETGPLPFKLVGLSVLGYVRAQA